MTTAFDATDRQLLNVLQSSFPLTEEPFREIGRRLDLAESEVIDRIQRLKGSHVVRQISAIFDTRRLGYKTVLVAMRLPRERLDAGARIISKHPGVSHNYARAWDFNLWFTLAIPPEGDLEDTVKDMAQRTGAEAYRLMPATRFFKIGVTFDMVTEDGAAENHSPDSCNPKHGDEWQRAEALSEFEIGVIREIQKDLPVESRPFERMAECLDISERELLSVADDLQQRGIMRRFCAVLNHLRAGFKANAMAVWKVPEERAEEVGNIMAQSKRVTHCCQRTTRPDWGFTHFTMIHSTSPEQCEKVAREIAKATGIGDYQLLYSTREYKKVRVRYFV